MEKNVSDIIEESVNTLSGIKTLRSTSAEGYSLVLVEFQLEKNIDVAYQEVQARVNTIKAQLPTDADDPVIEKFDPDAAPILTVVLSGDLGPRELYRVADKIVKDRLQRVRDVGSVKIVGGRDRKIWLWIDPVRLREHSLTVQDVSRALAQQHVEMPGGRIETQRQELVTRTKAEFRSAAELDELIVSRQGGQIIRLKDIGRTEDGLEELRSYSQKDDKPGIALEVRRQSGTNTVRVASDVKAEIARLSRELQPQGLGSRAGRGDGQLAVYRARRSRGISPPAGRRRAGGADRPGLPAQLPLDVHQRAGAADQHHGDVHDAGGDGLHAEHDDADGADARDRPADRRRDRRAGEHHAARAGGQAGCAGRGVRHQ
jgi:HAE1 family hydrophobic/amphiphilic exporter-1